MRLKLIPDDTKINFMGMGRIAVAVSSTAVIASIVLFLTMGLNFGIDFRGGTMIEARTPQAADLRILAMWPCRNSAIRRTC
jgi:preprotein translocase subunit SecF